jgi:hypothetical protein
MGVPTNRSFNAPLPKTQDHMILVKCTLRLELSPKLRQTVKSQNSANGELTHGIVSTEVHKGSNTGGDTAAGDGVVGC